MRAKLKEIWLYCYTFVAIFQPPFLPIATVYIFGLLSLVLFLMNWRKNWKIWKKSGMSGIYTVFCVIGIYALTISVIDILFIDNRDLIINRLKCINQLLILTGIQFLGVNYVLKCAKDLHYNFYDILRLVVIVGILQGICALLAYILPSVRSFFLKYAGDIFENPYVLERRGYGFSGMLLDTFGYGMGIIAGCALFFLRKRRNLSLLGLILSLVATLLNARTGIVIFAIAVLVFICKSKNNKLSFAKIALGLPVVFVLIYFCIPPIISVGMESTNYTVKWAIGGINSLYNAIFSQGGSLSSASFVSDWIFPSNPFELIFGSGHSVYGIIDIIGYHSDIGYVNLIWTYGMVGSAIILFVIFKIFWCAYKTSTDNRQKIIVIFLWIAYLATMVKAILIGNNPGTTITYLLLFSMIFYGNNKKSLLKCGTNKRIKYYGQKI